MQVRSQLFSRHVISWLHRVNRERSTYVTRQTNICILRRCTCLVFLWMRILRYLGKKYLWCCPSKAQTILHVKYGLDIVRQIAISSVHFVFRMISFLCRRWIPNWIGETSLKDSTTQNSTYRLRSVLQDGMSIVCISTNIRRQAHNKFSIKL